MYDSCVDLSTKYKTSIEMCVFFHNKYSSVDEIGIIRGKYVNTIIVDAMPSSVTRSEIAMELLLLDILHPPPLPW